MRNLERYFVAGMTSLLCFALVPASTLWAEDTSQTPDISKQKDKSPENLENIEDQGARMPAGMSLDDVLDRAERPPPGNYPDAISDDQLHVFLLVDQLEYRYALRGEPDQAGTEFKGWFGGDYNRLWLKGEGEASWQGDAGFAGESESDLLYGRLFAPFWNAQIGVQYANEWSGESYKDFWSGVLALQGLAPGMFEVDASLYLTENFNALVDLEAEYDIRITQRLVFQPRAELSFSAQNVEARGIGIGMRSVVVDLRLRYEFLREFAPYLGARFQGLVFGTADRARAAGEDTNRFFVVGGVRFALY